MLTQTMGNLCENFSVCIALIWFTDNDNFQKVKAAISCHSISAVYYDSGKSIKKNSI